MGQITPIRLADEPAFALGDVTVDPASRTLTSGRGALSLEPRTMQVLVLLARCRGEVVGRTTLIDACWDGRIVGDDAVNRAILKLRRALTEVGGDLAVDTIARVGYRLKGGGAVATRRVAAGRRRLITQTGAALAGVAGVGFLAWRRSNLRPAPAQVLYDRGRAAFQQGSRDDNAQAVGFFERAAVLSPDDAAIAGALALAYRFEQTFLGPAVLAQSTRRADVATARALQLDRRDADAIAARAMYLPFGNHWLETERRLRDGLRQAPGSGVMNGFLGMVLAAVGRTHEAIAAYDRAIGGANFVPLLRAYRVQALFAASRVADVDRELQAAIDLWPRFAPLWWLRFWTLALTGRLEAALAHTATKARLPNEITPEQLDAARRAVAALESGAPAEADTAVAAWTAVANRSAAHWPATIGLSAAFGRRNEALSMIVRYLAPLAAPHVDAGPGPGFLFGAPLAILRSTPQFWSICGRVGLRGYWIESGTRPDAAVALGRRI